MSWVLQHNANAVLLCGYQLASVTIARQTKNFLIGSDQIVYNIVAAYGCQYIEMLRRAMLFSNNNQQDKKRRNDILATN
jgi:hypothetical protein